MRLHRIHKCRRFRAVVRSVMLLVTFCIFSIFPGTWNIFFFLSFKCACVCG